MSNNVFVRIFRFYRDGFHKLTVKKAVGTNIVSQLFIMFVILKLFFFSNFVKLLLMQDKNLQELTLYKNKTFKIANL
ncbi:MAG: DUF4492 domain-containing protein [Candidatus Azobacteroides sp.]|nr:DUF4492 domain-containing protein [Candidatus Azobacteroides sp.]